MAFATKTPDGDRLVLLSRAEHEGLMALLAGAGPTLGDKVLATALIGVPGKIAAARRAYDALRSVK